VLLAIAASLYVLTASSDCPLSMRAELCAHRSHQRPGCAQRPCTRITINQGKQLLHLTFPSTQARACPATYNLRVIFFDYFNHKCQAENLFVFAETRVHLYVIDVEGRWRSCATFVRGHLVSNLPPADGAQKNRGLRDFLGTCTCVRKIYISPHQTATTPQSGYSKPKLR
jgi:hypothetical protein